MIDISGLNKAEVLMALYNASRPLGNGRLEYDPKPMAKEEAEDLLKTGMFFEYIKGRVMKIDLKSNSLEVDLYDRDNGAGAAEAALMELLTRPVQPRTK